jgi:eukaryotic-like serine/threonine-protein kinase
VASIALLTWPILWVLWAFVARGGFSYRIAGLALVRRDGRPAARWQCARRALLVWLPVTALLIASVWLDAWYWMAWQPDDPRGWMLGLSQLTWWGGLGLLAVFVWKTEDPSLRSARGCLES